MPTPSLRFRRALTALFAAVALAPAVTAAAPRPPAAAAVPSPRHVVVVVLENHSSSEIVGSPAAPFVSALAAGGATLTAFHAETHPSQPNYFFLFSGGSQGITTDGCYTPGFSSAPNLASELAAAGRSWASYNEGLPRQGSTVCADGRTRYARKHNPWFGFSDVPVSTARPFTRFPSDFAALPRVSFVIPDLCHDMHDCPVRTGDRWLRRNLGAYARWARTHDSLLVVTADEDDGSHGNRIPTVLYGQPVAPGSTSGTRYDHVDLLRTIEDMEGTGHAGGSATASDITGVWR